MNAKKIENQLDRDSILLYSCPMHHDPLIGGTINQTGSFLMTAEKVGSETLLALANT
jgi:hypothetical protein